MCSVLTRIVRARRDHVQLQRRAANVAHDGSGFDVTLDDGTRYDGDGLLVAVGRRPNIPAGTVERAGIALDARGYIALRRALAHIVAGHYALGDVAGQPQFTHVSWEDFRRLEAIIGGDLSRTRADRVLGYAMYTEPQVGRVGITADASTRARDARTASSRSSSSDVARGPEWNLEDGLLPAGRRPADRRDPRRHVRGV